MSNYEYKNPIEQTNHIKEKFSEYIRSTFDIRDPIYKNLFYQKLDEMEKHLYKGPYLASSLPFKQSFSINDLIKKGELEEGMKSLGNIDVNRPNYYHQVECIEKINSGRSIVVTTGTGSGKTECFMYPIINYILKERRLKKEKGEKYNNGVRAILLFPMNALVYDQIDRLREILANSEITYGFYTGKTPEENDYKIRNEMRAANITIPTNELFTRKAMRETPPDILFTNYSMLEYLLLRPIDSSLISKSALSNWQFVVLDEAHTYRGALGIEIALLMRRLCGIANKKPQFILTSATLGKGKEDIKKIVLFANSLTSSAEQYEESDIIFGERLPLPFSDGQYRIAPQEYIDLLNNLENLESVKTIFADYIEYDESKSLNVNLYNILSRDKNVYELYRRTQYVPTFYDVLKYSNGFSVESLTSLIELISKAQSEAKVKLFDIKYHVFIKAPDGAFISLGHKKMLSLTSKSRFEDGYKAFKIGICSNCKVPYIMGITSPEGILSIDDEIDIDEAYAVKMRRLEYYLIADCLTQEEISEIESDDQKFEKYVVCAKCGSIARFKTGNDLKCDCKNKEQTILYKYKEKTSKEDGVTTNNLHKCPVCKYTSRGTGIVMGFHIGKDRATSLISQILYESMKQNYQIVKKRKSVFGSQIIEEKEKIRKQFIAFSDSRQQAAFFNKFINTLNDRFLKKALIWDLLKQNNHNPIKYSDLVQRLNDRFISDFGEDASEAELFAKSGALWELFEVDGRNSAEGIGMFAFKLDFTGQLADDSYIAEGLKQNGFSDVSPQQFRDLMSVTFDLFRTSPAIKYGYLDTDKERREELLGYRNHDIYVMLQDSNVENGEEDDDDEDEEEVDEKKKYKRIRSYLPAINKNGKSGLNDNVRFVKTALGYNDDKAKQLLQIIYEVAKENNLLVPGGNNNFPNTEKINATSYSVHSYKRLNYFKCNLCGKMTIYNINNACTDAKCQGKLIPVVDVDSITDNNYYRKEYMNRAIEKIDCREHTAQMNSDEAKAIQNDFKNKKLNIISCSTTFEMGIDLGGLNTVYMRNVPPTPANYAQRAGRAGRRADTSAYILTFCSLSSHDFTYFDEPPAMIKGLVDPPYFLIDNDKIILRHITAAVLSVYFRKNPTEFASVDNFINLDVIGHLLSYIQSKPQELGNYIDHYILESQDLINKYGNFKWTNYLCRPENPLYKMKTGLEEEMQLLKEAYEYEKATENHDAAKKAQEALRVFKEDSSLVTSLTKYNVIPGYGFPIDTVNLFIWDQQSEDMDSHYNLSRNLPIAISEYAPDSEVIVDGKKYTSRYLMIPKKANALPTTQYVECDNCHQKNLAPQSVMGHFKQGDTCVYCGTPLVLNNGKLKSFVTPIYGFVADKRNKATRRIKPAKTYASDVFYVGKGIQNGDSISINNVVTLTEFKDEQLLVMNENRFFTCDLCGYSVLEKAEDKKNRVPHIIANHETFRGDPCSNNKLNPVSLGHTYSTDVIKIEFSNILEMQDEETALSVLYALLSGISIAYTIEREDINGIIFRKNITKPYSLILFDAVPGGAGHVKRLKESGSVEKIIRAALKKVENCECGLETSCYGCLRTYNNQKIHKHLIRGKAVDALRKILDALLDTKIKFSIVGVPHTEFTDASSIQDFINDELLDEAENNIFTDLFAEIKLKGAEFPDGYWYTLKSSDGRKTIKPSFVWEQKKILLFEPTRENEYHFMINNQNYYHCYLMNNSFDVLSFVDDLLKQ